jgi:hypothetical protein
MDYIVVKHFKYRRDEHVTDMKVGKIISSLEYDENVFNKWIKDGWIKKIYGV